VNLARKLAPVRLSPQAEPVSKWDQWRADQTQPLEATTSHPAITFVPGELSVTARGLEAPQSSGFGIPRSHGTDNARPPTGRRSGRWKRTAWALAPTCAALLFGTTLFVAVFEPKGGSTGARSAVTRPALVKIVGSEERPTDLHVDPSSAVTPSSELSRAGVTTPSIGPPRAAPVTPVAALGPVVPQPAETNPVRTVSAQPDATAAPSATRTGETGSLDVLQLPAKATLMAESKVVVGAPPPTPNLVWPAKLSRRPPVSVTVAKAAATAPSARAQMRRQPQRAGASTILPASAEPHTTTAAPAAAQEPVNPMAHVPGALAGVLGTSAVDQRASKSGDWAIQFASPKSEAEAEAAAARLNVKYAPALNGATIGVHKTQANGETIYALRVAGLSKADATALCVRVKGRDCFIPK
jgi:hypothetical protein